MVQRADDNEAVVLERLKVYHRQSEPLVEYYRVRPTFRSINGAQAPDRVAADLVAAIEAAGLGSDRQRGAVVIVCRSAAELEKMREAGRLVGEVLTELTAMVAPGITTAELDEVAERADPRRRRDRRRSRAITATRRRSARRSTKR